MIGRLVPFRCPLAAPLWVAEGRSANPPSAVVYEGRSKLGGSPIVVVATGLRQSSANTKTGAMVQTWIIRADVHPVEARRQGLDVAICGDCPFRAGGCYVNVGQAPGAVFRVLDKLPRVLEPGAIADLAERAGVPVRIGSYGDPAAVPASVWRALLSGAARAGHGRHTGYSHQWRNGSHRHLRALVMASTEDPKSTRQAWANGWRTFRVRPAGSLLLPGEIDCPAVTHGRSCADCKLCFGAHPSAPSVSIEAHGGAVQRRVADRLAKGVA